MDNWRQLAGLVSSQLPVGLQVATIWPPSSRWSLSRLIGRPLASARARLGRLASNVTTFCPLRVTFNWTQLVDKPASQSVLFKRLAREAFGASLSLTVALRAAQRGVFQIGSALSLSLGSMEKAGPLIIQINSVSPQRRAQLAPLCVRLVFVRVCVCDANERCQLNAIEQK